MLYFLVGNAKYTILGVEYPFFRLRIKLLEVQGEEMEQGTRTMPIRTEEENRKGSQTPLVIITLYMFPLEGLFYFAHRNTNKPPQFFVLPRLNTIQSYVCT